MLAARRQADHKDDRSQSWKFRSGGWMERRCREISAHIPYLPRPGINCQARFRKSSLCFLVPKPIACFSPHHYQISFAFRKKNPSLSSFLLPPLPLTTFTCALPAQPSLSSPPHILSSPTFILSSPNLTFGNQPTLPPPYSLPSPSSEQQSLSKLSLIPLTSTTHLPHPHAAKAPLISDHPPNSFLLSRQVTAHQFSSNTR